MPTLEEIGTRLQDQDIGTVNTDIFLASEPDTPDALVAVLPTAGLESIRTMGVPDSVLRPSFQVLARVSRIEGAGAARDKIQAVRAALHGFSGSLSGGGKSAQYHDIKALQSEGVPIRSDASLRHRWVCNFQAHKGPSA